MAHAVLRLSRKYPAITWSPRTRISPGIFAASDEAIRTSMRLTMRPQEPAANSSGAEWFIRGPHSVMPYPTVNGEPDAQQEVFYFAVEGAPPTMTRRISPPEGVREYLACGRLDETVHGRYERRKPDGSGLHAFEHLFACELFQNPRHGAYYVWMYPLKRLGEYLGRGDMAEQRDMGACREGASMSSTKP